MAIIAVPLGTVRTINEIILSGDSLVGHVSCFPPEKMVLDFKRLESVIQSSVCYVIMPARLAISYVSEIGDF
jgi:hypothetical protein